MKILFLANRIPYPPYRGDKLKIYNLARRLNKKHELHLLTFAQEEEELQYREELEKIFTKVHLVLLPKWRSVFNCVTGIFDKAPFQVVYFRSAEMRNKLHSVLVQDKFDAIHVQHLRMSPYLADRADIPRILDLPDAYSLYWERRKKTKRNLLQQIFENTEQKRVLQFEKVLHMYDMALVCSPEDKEHLQKSHGVDNIRLLPNGVDLETFAPRNHDYSHNHTLLFTGNMDYAPNVDAVLYFVNDILPIVRKKFPEVKFIIAGQRPVPKVQELASEHIQVTGFVKDLSEVYNSASVVVAPLRFGAGTQNKVLEAMAMGVPVVCSNIGFKGLGITSGEGAIMQTDKDQFAQSVIDLLSSEQMRREVGTKGMEIVRGRFGWDAIAAMLEGYLQEVADKK